MVSGRGEPGGIFIFIQNVINLERDNVLYSVL